MILTVWHQLIFRSKNKQQLFPRLLAIYRKNMKDCSLVLGNQKTFCLYQNLADLPFPYLQTSTMELVMVGSCKGLLCPVNIPNSATMDQNFHLGIGLWNPTASMYLALPLLTMVTPKHSLYGNAVGFMITKRYAPGKTFTQ